MPDPGFPANRKSQPNILAFDTAGPFVSVGWSTDGKTGGTFTEMARGQAEALFPTLEQALTDHSWSWDHVDGLGVGIGPGNFTGIRISVSAARGLGLALGIPVFGLSQFALALGSAFIPPGTLVSVAAPRDMAYVQGEGPPRLIDPSAPPPDLFSATCVHGFRAAEIAGHLGSGAVDTAPGPDPAAMAAITLTLYREATAFPARPAPLYVKPPDAAPARDPAPVILT